MTKAFPKVLTFLAAAALAAAASAGARESRTITIGHVAAVEDGSIAPGNYIVSWKTHSPEATVTFETANDHKLVMTAHARVEKRSKAYDNDMVVYHEAPDGSRTVEELRFAGSNKVLVLTPPTSALRPPKPAPVPSSRIMPRYVPGIGYVFDNTVMPDPLLPSANPPADPAGKHAIKL